jgi:hypothetical protein
VLDGAALAHVDVGRVAAGAARVEIGDGVLGRLGEQRRALEAAASGDEAHYGINTGFGSFSRQRIEPGELRELQANLIRSHAAGVGRPAARGSFARCSSCSPRRCAAGVGRAARAGPGDRGAAQRGRDAGGPGARDRSEPQAISLRWRTLPSSSSARARRPSRRASVLPGGEALAARRALSDDARAKEGLALINGTHLMAARLALLGGGDRAPVARRASPAPRCRSTPAGATDASWIRASTRLRNQPQAPSWSPGRCARCSRAARSSRVMRTTTTRGSRTRTRSGARRSCSDRRSMVHHVGWAHSTRARGGDGQPAARSETPGEPARSWSPRATSTGCRSRSRSTCSRSGWRTSRGSPSAGSTRCSARSRPGDESPALPEPRCPGCTRGT